MLNLLLSASFQVTPRIVADAMAAIPGLKQNECDPFTYYSHRLQRVCGGRVASYATEDRRIINPVGAAPRFHLVHAFRRTVYFVNLRPLYVKVVPRSPVHR